MLVRPKAWWYSKIPLSFTFLLLVADGRPFNLVVVALLLAVVVTVCGAANFGYAINELFDIPEDRLIGRDNTAARLGKPRVWLIVSLSAVLSLTGATFAGGFLATGLTIVELCLPLAYSVPPMRAKERKWFGVASDALAAHVYPAVLALVVAEHLGVRPVSGALFASAFLWSLAAGLRGILSHQLYTAEQDRIAGLRTVVSDIGAVPLERAIVVLLVPLEIMAFAGTVFLCWTGIVAWVLLTFYVLYESVRTVSGRFRVSALRRGGQKYVPMLEENLYKAWAPIVFALDAARIDFLYLAVVPFYALLFMPHLRIEWRRISLVFAAKS